MSSCCGELVNDFNSLINDLTPTDTFYKAARQAAHIVFELLKQLGSQRGVKIGRTIVAGSIGKGTAIFYYDKNGNIRYPDLDLVVFVNDRKPPYGEVYNIFEDILQLINVGYIRKSLLSLQFDILTESYELLRVDLLAAENHVVNTRLYAGCDIGDIEAVMTFLTVNAEQKSADDKLRSSAFAEKTVRIIKDFVEDDFVLKVVYLAKNWMRSVDLSEYGYIPAKSAIVEAIAIDAQRTKSGRRTCLISGFRRFLELMKDFQNLDIRLNDDNENDVEDYLPWIQDPGNCSNNLAKRMPPKAMEVLEQQATKTLEILEQVRNKEEYSVNGNAINAIFDHKNSITSDHNDLDVNAQINSSENNKIAFFIVIIMILIHIYFNE